MILSKEMKASPDYLAIDAAIAKKLAGFLAANGQGSVPSNEEYKKYISDSISEWEAIMKKCGIKPIKGYDKAKWTEIFVLTRIKESTQEVAAGVENCQDEGTDEE